MDCRRAIAVSQTNAPLETVLGVLATDRDGPGAAVIIDGDIRAVRRAGSVAREHAVPALWWCDGPPADEIHRDTLQLIDAVLAPVDEASIGRYVPIGAGIDTRSLGNVPLAPRPPLRLLVLGRAVNQGGLAVTLRALAESRARGTDAHLILVDSVRISSFSARQTAESLIADLSLTQSVELIDGDGQLSLPRILRRVHAVIDAGTDTEVDHEVLEAMASDARSSRLAPRSHRCSPTSRCRSSTPSAMPCRSRLASPRWPTPGTTSSSTSARRSGARVERASTRSIVGVPASPPSSKRCSPLTTAMGDQFAAERACFCTSRAAAPSRRCSRRLGFCCATAMSGLSARYSTSPRIGASI